MRVFIAGATGAIGKPLVKQLLERKDHVIGATRSESSATELRAMGAQAVILDAFDFAAVKRAVVEARPEVVVHQLTSLPKSPSPVALKKAFASTAKIRRETVPVFIDAAREAGAKRFIAQSISFVTRPDGPADLDESAPLWTDGCPSELRETIEAVRILEDATTSAKGLEGLVLRYGFYYGTGTWYAKDGAIGWLIQRRLYPVLGEGTGRASFIHIDDAASATMLACDRGPSGIYNITDDDPVPASEFVPEIARQLGAKPPRRLPVWLGRLTGGAVFAHYNTTLRGAKSAKAKEALGWTPRSWRTGFREVFAR